MQIAANSSVLSLLTIIFVVLKITGTIAWSWWWVMSPFLLSLALLALALFILTLIVRS